MATDFKLPELGENIVGGTVVKVLVKPGDAIKKDQSVLELETDKATIEVPSPVEGKVSEILVREAQEIRVGQVVMKIEAGAAASSAPSTTPAPKSGTTQTVPTSKVTAPATPAQSTPVPTPTSVAPQPTASTADVAAAPTVRRFARELGVDITQVRGSGPGGRISKDDVKAYTKMRMTSATALPSAGGGVAARPLPDFAKWGKVERAAMNNIRKKTADHLTYCWQTIPHVTQFDKADITELEKLRQRYSTPQRKLTITPFLLKVIAAALRNFPRFNSSVDMTTHEIIQKNYYNVGVAVDTENGLLVPVIRDIDKKSIFELADELTQAAERARTKKTSLDELQGGCFTITNLGGIGGTYFTPIVNWPEVAILGVSRAQMETNYANSVCTPRLMLPLSLSYDHRVIDGADGARFIRWVVDAIQQPFLMELDKK